MGAKIKKGTICTFIGNHNTLFRLCGKNSHKDYPYADVVMFKGEIVQCGGRSCPAFTTEYEEASDEEKVMFFKKFAEVEAK